MAKINLVLVPELAAEITAQCARVDELSKVWHQVEDQLEADPENAELEALTDQHYARYWDGVRQLASLITKVTAGAIDGQTAAKMALHRRAQICALLEKSRQPEGEGKSSRSPRIDGLR